MPGRLVYFDYNRQSGAWVIRDFIIGQWLDNGRSPLTVAEIEADAVFDEFPPWCSVLEEPAQWRIYLRLRTTACLGRDVPMDLPNRQSGAWEPF